MHPRMVASIAVDAHSVCAHICAAAQETVVNGTALGWSVELRYTNYRARLLLIRLADTNKYVETYSWLIFSMVRVFRLNTP